MTATPERREKAPRDTAPVLPTQTRDDTDAGWGERARSDDDRLHEDRPPHWGSD